MRYDPRVRGHAGRAVPWVKCGTHHRRTQPGVFELMCRYPANSPYDYRRQHGVTPTALEEVTGVPFYFATPHHSWERGTNEKHQRTFTPVPAQRNQLGCPDPKPDAIAETLNTRPRHPENVLLLHCKSDYGYLDQVTTGARDHPRLVASARRGGLHHLSIHAAGWTVPLAGGFCDHPRGDNVHGPE